ncbi:hypothetical protein ASG82_05000 [Mycobacterium sp. Soil538]|nr:hypothetical protein ASG82_05000 [Mycobacterium sp. Soil538]
MGFSRHIGRIGALAVALGVGTGVGACPGIAWADESTDSTSSVAGPSSRGDDAAKADPAPNAGDAATDDPGDGAGDTDTHEDADDAGAPVDSDTDAEDAESESDAAPARERSGRRVHHAPPKTEAAAVERTRRAELDAPAPDVTPDAPAVEPVRETAVAPAPAPSVAPAVVDTAVPAAPEVTDPPAATARIRLTDLLSSLLTPRGAPTAPAESPAMWVLAAAARRQLGHTETAALVSASQEPVAELPVVNDPDDAGVVTGSVVVPGAAAAVASTPPGKGAVTVSLSGDTVSFTYTPTRQARHAAAALGAGDDAKTDSFVLTVSDSAGVLTSLPITVPIAPANAVPKVTVTTPRVSLTSAEVRASVRVRDADGDSFTFAVSPTAKGGSVTVDEDGHISYVPTDAARHAAAAADATDADKTDTFDVTVADGYGGLVTVTVTVPVKPDNIDPTVTVRTRSSLFSDTVTGVVKVKDPNGDPVTYDVSPSAKGGTVTIDEKGRFVYTPSAQARHAAAADDASRRDKQDTFLVTVTDDHGGITRTLVTVGIKPANTPPATAATRDVFTNPNTGVVTGAVVAVDADGDPFTYRFPTKTRKGAVEIDEDGGFTYTPTEQARAQASKPWARADAFRVTIDDGHGGTTTLTVRVTIAPLGGPNQAPTDGGFTASQPGAFTGKVTGSVTATDPDRDLLTFTGSGPTAKGAVVVDADGTFTYTPSDAARHQATADNATEADLLDTFTVTASDGYGGTLDIPVTVAIKPSVNRAPARGTYTADADALTGVVSGRVGAVDADGDLLTYRGTTVTEKGSVVVYNAGDFTYTPTDDARAAAGAPTATLADKRDSFTVTVDDGHGGTLAVTVRVTILPASVSSAL